MATLVPQKENKAKAARLQAPLDTSVPQLRVTVEKLAEALEELIAKLEAKGTITLDE